MIMSQANAGHKVFNTHSDKKFLSLNIPDFLSWNMVILPFLGVFQTSVTKFKNVASSWSV